MKHCGCSSSGQGKGSFLRLPIFTDKLFYKPAINNYSFKETAIKCLFLSCRCREQFNFHLSHPCNSRINLFCSKNFPTKSTWTKILCGNNNHNKKHVLSQCNLNVDGIITALLPLQLAAAFFMFAYEAWTVRLSLQRPSVEDLKIQPQQLKWQQQRWIGHIMTQNIQLFISSRRTWNIMSKFWQAT